jgi:TetR/AcrR family transcriptional repressor of nem operon
MTGRPREFEREEALDKAMDLFWSQGYEATGVAQLCDHMGLGRQSLYNTFGDKESLFTEALQRYRDQRLNRMVDILRAPGSGLSNVLTVLALWEETSTDMAHKGCLMANSIAEFGIREPRFSAELGSMLGLIEGAFTHALERARDDGELPQRRDPRTLARLFTTLGQGLSTVGKLDPTGSFQRDAVASARQLLES